MKNLLYIYIVLISTIAFSQKKDDFSLEDYQISQGDTINVYLDEIKILPKHKFTTRTDVNYYLWFRKKVFKAYPFATLASRRLDSLNVRLSRIQSKRKRRKYTRLIQKYVEGEFTEQIKKMTRTEGRILIKLIHRQTGNTAFQNIKKYRSGWKAFWYNTTANLFKLSLKTKYNPAVNNEDYLIEDVLQRAFLEENLIPQASRLDFDAFKILESNKGRVNVEKYKKMFAKMRKKRARKEKRKAKNEKK